MQLKKALFLFVFQDNPGKVSTLEYKLHGLENGDHVAFKEVQGMTELNDNTYPVKGEIVQQLAKKKSFFFVK